MKFIAVLNPSDASIDHYNVYSDGDFVYIHQAGGYGAKKKLKGNEGELLIERIAMEKYNLSNEDFWKIWEAWDYYSDHEFAKLGCKKAPVT